MSSTVMEEMLEQVGSNGCFQLLLVPLSVACVPPAAWSMLLMMFGAMEPDWWCADPVGNMSLSTDWEEDIEGQDTTTAGVAQIVTYSLLNRTSLPLDYSTEKQCGHKDGSDGSCKRIVFAPGMNTVVTEFQLVCDLSWVPSVIISVQMAGVFIGAALTGCLSDAIGRKKVIFSLMASLAAFNFMAVFVSSWQIFAVTRMLIGFSSGGVLTILFGYLTEFINNKWRAVLGAMPLWGTGALLYSFIVWLLPDWSHQHIVTGVFSAACLPFWIFFLPESVRWLYVQGRVEEAHRVLVQIAKWNRTSPPSLQSIPKVDHLDACKSHEKKYTCFRLFSTLKMAKMSMLHAYIWISVSMTYYALSFGVKNMSGDFYLNLFLLTAFEIPPALLVSPMLLWFGRRLTLFVCFMLSAVCAAVIVPISLFLTSDEAGTYINICCIVARVGIVLGWNVMTLFVAELYPTVIRNVAFSFTGAAARLGGIIAPYIIFIGELYSFYATISVIILFTALAPLLMPETKGKPLPDEISDKTEPQPSNSISDFKAELEVIIKADD